MTNLRRLSILFAVLALSSGAFAAEVGFTATIPSSPADFNTTISFDPFDSSLGTLTGISILLSSTADMSLDITNTGGTDPVNIYGGAGISVMVGSPDGTQPLVIVFPSFLVGSVGTPYSLYVGAPYNTSGTASDSATGTVDAMWFSAFTGSDPVVLPVSATVSSTLTQVGTGSYTPSLAGSANARITLVYTYDEPPSETPEPAAFMLFGSGLLGLGYWRRRA